jgi:hypothetical protein
MGMYYFMVTYMRQKPDECLDNFIYDIYYITMPYA